MPESLRLGQKSDRVPLHCEIFLTGMSASPAADSVRNGEQGLLKFHIHNLDDISRYTRAAKVRKLRKKWDG
jgi:hypothetical protein